MAYPLPLGLCAPQVSKLVHAIKMGWIKPRKPREETPAFYDLWAQEDPNSILGRHKMHVPAPKLPLPGHEESYNPPPEYLPTVEEVSMPMAGPEQMRPTVWAGRGGNGHKAWMGGATKLSGTEQANSAGGVASGSDPWCLWLEAALQSRRVVVVLGLTGSEYHQSHATAPELSFPLSPQKLAWEQQEPSERKLSVLPQPYNCLRHVPAYPRFIHERFERCLDLYLCPRQRKMRVCGALHPSLPLGSGRAGKAIGVPGNGSELESKRSRWNLGGASPALRGWQVFAGEMAAEDTVVV